ncbi:SDR family oxidoreductase [Yinghuangia sp. ASG 101]|uniref:SDR family oxidoreductase n=1 Tax=Yinghuangia sp. ASG 101 TaxID=2896848 RepID=UPI001E658046|nr:SDR family oxidoreductase [Yinghuangia sp. ASG 101]UGQ14940.1 SDR family oxidoreductase [Yinghuangia sp. ASG 101]
MTAGFTGKVALLTGASRGIGLGIAAELAAGGAKVCLTARRAEELDAAVRELGGPAVAMAVPGRADDAEHRAEAVAAVIDRFGSLDVLVNNAGINPHYGSLMDADLAAVRKILDVNVVSALGWTQAAYGAWMKEHGGTVLNVASVGGIVPGPFIGAYNVSKAALIHLTRQLAAELGPGVRVNAVAPAVVKTRFAEALYEGREEEAAATYPMKRLGVPEDVAKAAGYLLSDDASWITGETLVVDGGVTIGGRVG